MFRFGLSLVAVAFTASAFAAAAANKSSQGLNCSVGSSGTSSANTSLPSSNSSVSSAGLIVGQCVLYSSSYEARVERLYGGGTMAKIVYLDGSTAMVKAETLAPSVESYVGANRAKKGLYSSSYPAELLVRYAGDYVSIRFTSDNSQSIVKLSTISLEVDSFEGLRSGDIVLYSSSYEAKILKIYDSGLIEIRFLSDNSSSFVRSSTLLKADE